MSRLVADECMRTWSRKKQADIEITLSMPALSCYCAWDQGRAAQKSLVAVQILRHEYFTLVGGTGNQLFRLPKSNVMALLSQLCPFCHGYAPNSFMRCLNFKD